MISSRPWLVATRPAQALLAPLGVAVGSSYAHFDAQPGPGIPAHLLVTAAAFAAGVGVNLIEHGWDRIGEPPPDRDAPPTDSAPGVDARDAFIAGVAAGALAA